MKKLDIRIYLVAILVLAMILTFAISCTKDDINSTLQGTLIIQSNGNDWEEMTHAGIEKGLITPITWGGITYSQTKIRPIPAVMPYNTLRHCNCKGCGWLLIADTNKPITDSTVIKLFRQN